MPLPIQLLCTDFDGTLHAEFENPSVPFALQTLIADWQQNGVKWVINTGRDLASLLESMARGHLTIKPDYIVTVEREIYCHQDSRYVGLETWNTQCHQAHQALFDAVRADIAKLNAWVEQRFSTTLYEDAYSPFCLVAESNEDTDAIQVFLEDYCRQVPNLTVVRNDVYARFSHAAYNKGTALAEIARLLDIHPARILAAGDHLNDLPMLQRDFAHWLIAPFNAVPAVKEAVRRQQGFVSNQTCGSGLLQGLQRLLGGIIRNQSEPNSQPNEFRATNPP